MRFSFSRSSPIRTAMKTTSYPLTNIVTYKLERQSQVESPTISLRGRSSGNRPIEKHSLQWRHADAKRPKRSHAIRTVAKGRAEAPSHTEALSEHPGFHSPGDMALVAPVVGGLREIRVESDG